MDKLKEIAISKEELPLTALWEAAKDDKAGAVHVFTGTVRDNSPSKEGERKKVTWLEYECYEAMAIKEIRKIIKEAKEKWPIRKVFVHHRVGLLQIGEVAVVISLSTPHRKEGFEACAFIIDTFKQTVPIWKKEVYEDGASWVSAHP